MKDFAACLLLVALAISAAYLKLRGQLENV